MICQSWGFGCRELRVMTVFGWRERFVLICLCICLSALQPIRTPWRWCSTAWREAAPSWSARRARRTPSSSGICRETTATAGKRWAKAPSVSFFKPTRVPEGERGGATSQSLAVTERTGSCCCCYCVNNVSDSVDAAAGAELMHTAISSEIHVEKKCVYNFSLCELS